MAIESEIFSCQVMQLKIKNTCIVQHELHEQGSLLRINREPAIALTPENVVQLISLLKTDPIVFESFRLLNNHVIHGDETKKNKIIKLLEDL